jgi:hypothetical protein
MLEGINNNNNITKILSPGLAGWNPGRSAASPNQPNLFLFAKKIIEWTIPAGLKRRRHEQANTTTYK